MNSIFFVCFSLFIEGDTVKNKCNYYYDSLVNMNVYTQVDSKPIYSEKKTSIHSVFLKNIYIKDSANLSFMVDLDFIIDTCGNVISPRIRGKSESEYNELEKDVISITKHVKCWRPARCGNQPVLYLNRLRIILGSVW